ncbi:MAG TPA: ABC transporter permease [Chloroflexota bacterium]|nr:ABC transporter permease [Chloroflexota bacterium]
MPRFIARRLVATVPLLVLISILAFSLVLLLPGDPALAILGDEVANANDKQAYYALRAEMGLDEPIPIQYLRWAGKMLSGDLGMSIRNQTPIAETIGAKILPTAELALLAAILSLLIALPAGIISALRPNSLADAGATLAALSGVAVPHFFLGVLLIYAFAVGLRILPPSGYVAPWEDLGQNLRLMIMPAFTVGTGLAAILMRQVRSALIEVLQQEYVITARSKGLGERAVVIGHALKNAAIPVITIMGQQVGTLIGGAVVTETIFAIPGMGRLIVDSISYRDFPVVQATVLVLSISVLAANLTTDIIYGYLDPRIRQD